METYTLLREIADSWVLLVMFLFFLGAAIWAFLPSQNANREDARHIPFRNDTVPPPIDCENSNKKCQTADSAKDASHV